MKGAATRNADDHARFKQRLLRGCIEQQKHASHRISDARGSVGSHHVNEAGEMTQAAHPSIDEIDDLGCLAKAQQVRRYNAIMLRQSRDAFFPANLRFATEFATMQQDQWWTRSSFQVARFHASHQDFVPVEN